MLARIHSIILFFSDVIPGYILCCVDFDVDWSLSAPGATTSPTPTYRALATSANAGRQTTGGVVARTQSPRISVMSPTVDRWKPLSVETYSTEVSACVQPGPGSASDSAAGRDSPRPLVFDIELNQCQPDDHDNASPLQRLATMPRPDTPSNVW